MDERNRPDEHPETESEEDEGNPDIGRPHPAKAATGDPQEGLMVPRDEPRAADRPGVTATEQREGEALEDRLTQEKADEEPERRVQAGRLVEEGMGLTDHEKDEVASEASDDVDGLSAEEAAVRVDEEPEGLTGGPDRYLEEPGSTA